MSALAMAAVAIMGSRHEGTQPWEGLASSVQLLLGTWIVAATDAGGGGGGWALVANRNMVPLG
jgi:hypothetical protein